MDTKDNIPVIATSISILARFIFMYLIYINKSKNTYSLTFCILSIASSSMWIYYSVEIDNFPIILRSSTEIFLLLISSLYITYNKLFDDNHNEVVDVSGNDIEMISTNN